MSVAIWWVRRDLRLNDNPALAEAIKAGTQVVPLFFVDPFFENSPYVGAQRRSFLWAALADLDERLRDLGSYLVVRRGTPEVLLPDIVDELNASAVFAQEDYGTYARKRDGALKETTPLTLVQGFTYHHPSDVLKDDGDPYVVYTPYKNRWLERPLPRRNHLIKPPDALDTPADISSDKLPPVQIKNKHFPASEAEAQRRLSDFAENGIFQYDERRDTMAIHGTSQLSPYLRMGLLSPRQAILTAIDARRRAKNDEGREGAHTWLEELIWREFYNMILFHFPRVMSGSFRPVYDNIKWVNDEADFEAWCQGKTGYPIVDAAMRQLQEMGWMHNRSRMIVASFLVKDLLIDWRWGERWFMQHLVDGDPAANNGGWQWSAGTGTDAAPYFRIFNPTTQGEKYDKDGTYIRRFLPELKDVPHKYIHRPALMPKEVQREVGCLIGQDYPHPIVDHKAARQRALDAYKRAKDAENDS